MIYLKTYLLLLQVSAFSFGGAYSIWALIENQFVAECIESESGISDRIPKPEPATVLRLCRREFTAVLAVSEILPGPQINAISILAFRQMGIPGMLTVLGALMTPGLVLTPLVFALYARFKKLDYVRHFFSGAAIATISVLILFVINLSSGLRKNTDIGSGIIAVHIAISFWLSFRYAFNPFMIVISGGLFGYFFL